jgi:hypothetical protein
VRKIYQTAPEIPQALSNKAIEIIERHFTACGVRRAEDLPEESKVHLLRELRKFFQSELPAKENDGSGTGWDQERREGLAGYLLNLVARTLGLRGRQ